MTRAAKRFAASELERYLAGELEAGARAEIERAAREDGELAAWIAAREKERAQFAVDPRRREFSDLLREASGVDSARGDGNVRRLRRPSRFILSPLIAAAAALIVFLVMRPPEPRIGIKGGGLSVKAAVLERDGARLFGGGPLRPGSRLRLSVDDTRGGFVTVILEEAGGDIEVLYDSKELGRLGPGTHHLPGSLELDERLGRERLYVLVSDDEPKMEEWVEELRSAHRKLGFLHGWLPAGGTRVSLLEYEKVQ